MEQVTEQAQDATIQSATKLAWAALICAGASWFLSPFLPVGPDIAAVILGILALRKRKVLPKKMRQIAIVGIIAGAVKFVAVLSTLIWLVVAFMRNPIAH